MIGQTISHYKITAKLGEGGMGVVYKAEDTKLDRPVALKFLAPHLLRDDEARKRFEREAKAAARLDHPNICTVYEIDEAEGQTFLSMAYLEGETVREKIKTRPLKLEDVFDIAIQTAQGLQAAHEKGITHRDIKSANLIVTPKSQVKIMDFGLAQLVEQSRLTKSAMILGTPAYMSPEQARREPTDRRTDIWALGVVIYEMVTGKLPFEGEREAAVAYAVVHQQPEPITALRVGVPVGLDRIVAKAMAKDRDDRYQHADEMIVDFRGLKKELESGGTQAATATPSASHRTPWLLAGASALIALAVTAGAFLGLFESEERVAAEQPLEAVPLTSYSGSEQHPTFSPDGARVAFSWDGESQDNFDIYVKEIDSDNRQRLTTDQTQDTHPAWSPDGRFIAFLRRDPAAGKAKVVIIPSIGGPERVVGDSVAVEGPSPREVPAWTPDSKQLVIVDRSSPDEAPALFLLSIDTSETTRLTSPTGAWGDFAPAFSPDGKTLAFARGASFFSDDVFLLPLSDDLNPAGEPRRLTSIEQYISGLSWSTEGEAIVFGGGVGLDSQRLWKIPVSGGDVQPVAAAAGAGLSNPSISGPARRLAYVRTTDDMNVWAIRVGDGGSADPVKLLSSTRFDGAAYYSPDGTRITFTSGRTATVGIWLSDADGSNPEPLFLHPEGAFSGSGRFSPDGRHLAFDSYPDDNADIFVISASGGEPFRLTTHPEDDMVPSWSSDGKWVYFGSARSGRFEIWKAPAGGGEPVQVTTNGGNFALEDPAGEFLYYIKAVDARQTALWKIPAGGGEESKVLNSVFARNFAVAPGGIFFMQAPDQDDRDQAYSIRFLNLTDGRVELVARLPRNTVQTEFGLGVSPDGQSILYSQVDDISSDLMLIEGFE